MLHVTVLKKLKVFNLSRFLFCLLLDEKTKKKLNEKFEYMRQKKECLFVFFIGKKGEKAKDKYFKESLYLISLFFFVV